jgi:predicted Holliday junction resolvase-like endonuclease
MNKNIKYYLFTIFCTLILMFCIYSLENKVNHLEEKVRIQRVEIDSLVKNKAWVRK